MIIIVLISAFFIRIISLNQSFWLDEAINVLGAKYYPLIEMITQYAKSDFHPPGYFILIWIWGRIFGFSEISVRFPSVIFGLLSIFIIYLIGRKLISKKAGLLMAILLAVNPLHVYYSQEARMYSMAAFAVILNIFFLIKLFKKEKIGIIFLILSNLLVFVSDYVAYFIFPAELIFILSIQNKNNIKKWIGSFIISCAVFSLWLPVFLQQLGIGSNTASVLPAWKDVVGGTGLKPLVLTFVKFIIGRVSFDNVLVYAGLFLPIGLLFLFLIWRSSKINNQFVKKLTLFWIIVPVILASIISFFIPIYSYFRMLYVLPGFLILIALGIISFKYKLRIVLAIVIIIIELVFTSLYLFNPVFQREDWRGLVKYLESKSISSKVIIESSGNFAPLEYYGYNGSKILAGLKNFPAKSMEDLANLDMMISGATDIYLINYLVEISDQNRLIEKKITELKFKLLETKDFNGVGFVYHFTKQ